MADLADWLWTSGALLLGRAWLVLVLIFAAGTAAGYVHSRIRPQLAPLDDTHPLIGTHHSKGTRP